MDIVLALRVRGYRGGGSLRCREGPGSHEGIGGRRSMGDGHLGMVWVGCLGV